jgi:hypothetical protein
MSVGRWRPPPLRSSCIAFRAFVYRFACHKWGYSTCGRCRGWMTPPDGEVNLFRLPGSPVLLMTRRIGGGGGSASSALLVT